MSLIAPAQYGQRAWQAIVDALSGALAKGVLPALSETEREAIEAGDTWWDAALFSGMPRWQTLLDFPVQPLTPEEQAFLDGPVEELCRHLSDWEVNQLRDLPPPVWAFLKTHGFFGMIIPQRYGGLEFSARAQSRVVTTLSTRSVAAAVSVMVPNSLGPAELLLHYGTEEQKDHYLPRLAKGLEVPCFALTSPEAGSDAASIPDFGVVCKGMWQGKETLGMRVTSVVKPCVKHGVLSDQPYVDWMLDRLANRAETSTCALDTTGTPGSSGAPAPSASTS